MNKCVLLFYQLTPNLEQKRTPFKLISSITLDGTTSINNQSFSFILCFSIDKISIRTLMLSNNISLKIKDQNLAKVNNGEKFLKIH